jgi:hypothetical protein
MTTINPCDLLSKTNIYKQITFYKDSFWPGTGSKWWMHHTIASASGKILDRRFSCKWTTSVE